MWALIFNTRHAQVSWPRINRTLNIIIIFMSRGPTCAYFLFFFWTIAITIWIKIELIIHFFADNSIRFTCPIFRLFYFFLFVFGSFFALLWSGIEFWFRGEKNLFEMARRFLILLLTALVMNTPSCYGSIDDILKDIFTANGAENASSSITTMEPPATLSSSDLKGTMTGECVGKNKQQ